MGILNFILKYYLKKEKRNFYKSNDEEGISKISTCKKIEIFKKEI